MEFNDLLEKQDISPSEVLVVRHRPIEPKLRKMLPWLAAERHELYNAYQQAQFPKVEQAFKRAKYVASFIGVHGGKALFAGLYSVASWKPISDKEYWQIPENKTLHDEFDMGGLSSARALTLWFELILKTEFYATWRGRLIVQWPGLERSWWRWADRNRVLIDYIEKSDPFEVAMPSWDELVINWPDLNLLPRQWQAALSQWRGIYYIFDKSDHFGYVGAAYGVDNILGRWRAYGKSGHGGNKELRNRNPENFRFSILQRVSPDETPENVVQFERKWKMRLHTQEFGLNKN